MLTMHKEANGAHVTPRYITANISRAWTKSASNHCASDLIPFCHAGVIALFCRQYDIIKDNEPNNNKDKAKNSSECSTPEHPQGGLLRSNV